MAVAGHGVVDVYQVRGFRHVKTLRPGDAVTSIAFSSKKDTLAVGGESGGVYIGALRSPKAPLRAVEVARGSSYVLDVAIDERGRIVGVGADPTGLYDPIAFSIDGAHVLSTSCETKRSVFSFGRVRRTVALETPLGPSTFALWNRETGRVVGVPGTTSHPASAAFDSTGRFLLWGDYGEIISRDLLLRRSHVAAEPSETDIVFSLSLSRDGRRLASNHGSRHRHLGRHSRSLGRSPPAAEVLATASGPVCGGGHVPRRRC